MMRSVLSAVALAAAVLAVGGATAAAAQSFGQPTPGLCFLSRERVLDGSKAGAAANARLALFTRRAEQQLSGERAALAADANVLQIQRPVISEAVYQQRAGALALREQAFQAMETSLTDQLARTRAQVTARIIGETAQGLAGVIAERQCSAVLEATGAYAINPRMDLTTEVIAILDRRLPAIDFDLQPIRR